MKLVSFVVLNYLLLTLAIRRPNDNYMGPPCYGRSDCAVPFSEDIESNKPIKPDPPRRHVKDGRFKSPIFGAYRFNPLLGEFESREDVKDVNTISTIISTTAKKRQTTTVKSTAMRAYEEPSDTPVRSFRRSNDIYLDYF